jgi:hypothetical protein
MRERFLIGVLIGCLVGAACAPLLAQSWQRLYLTRSGSPIPLAADSTGAAWVSF